MRPPAPEPPGRGGGAAGSTGSGTTVQTAPKRQADLRRTRVTEASLSPSTDRELGSVDATLELSRAPKAGTRPGKRQQRVLWRETAPPGARDRQAGQSVPVCWLQPRPRCRRVPFRFCLLLLVCTPRTLAWRLSRRLRGPGDSWAAALRRRLPLSPCSRSARHGSLGATAGLSTKAGVRASCILSQPKH